MKKNIAILGSTGSIGNNLLKIVKKNPKDFNIILLSANKNYKKLITQAKKFHAKNLIISDENAYRKALIQLENNKKIKLYRDFKSFKKIFPKKIDYVMSSIMGLSGLVPTIGIIKYTNKIAIANKESLICGWKLIRSELNRYKTEFIPVDSEHFSVWFGLKGHNIASVEKIYLTASGGPFLNLPLKNFKKIKLNQALKHPNWKMGKKISIDSATLTNKLLELIEARNIFNIQLNKFSIIIHPDSYVHCIIKFKNGLTKLILHETDMRIPIENSIYNSLNKISNNHLNLKKLNNLKLHKVNTLRYPIIKLLKNIPNHHSLFDTVIVCCNEIVVKAFIEKLIKFDEISKLMLKIVSNKEFDELKYSLPSSINDILKINNRVKNLLHNYIS